LGGAFSFIIEDTISTTFCGICRKLAMVQISNVGCCERNASEIEGKEKMEAPSAGKRSQQLIIHRPDSIEKCTRKAEYVELFRSCVHVPNGK